MSTTPNFGTAPKPLKIFFHALDAIGHLNACIGLAQSLASRGHKIYFLLNKSFKGQVEKFGFEEILLNIPVPHTEKDGQPANRIKLLSNLIAKGGFLSAKCPLDKMKDQLASGIDALKETFSAITFYNSQIENAIQREKPDLFIIDGFVVPPAVQQAPCPWVFLCSAQPLSALGSKGNLPPYGAGFAVNSDPSTWEEYIDVWKQCKYEKLGGKAQEDINRAFNFSPTIKTNNGLTMSSTSPHLNIYGYPQELDYSDVYQIPDNYVRVDAYFQEIPEPFELPKEVAEMPGEKLIYLSLGSMGSVDVELMKRITSILAKTPYRCIVSKGPLADEYELPDNCWGQSFLPQTKILPLVDLVIAHGGNNTVTESLYFGKPQIVMPLFGDQYDSAQRVHEKGYGIRLEPYTFTESQLLNAMEKLLNDSELHQRLKVASRRMANSNTKQKVCERLEVVVDKYQADH